MAQTEAVGAPRQSEAVGENEWPRILRTLSQYSAVPYLPLIYYLLCPTDTRPRILRTASQYSVRVRDPGEHE
jgi:hypothetical protein